MNTVKQISALLDQRPHTADELRNALGLSHEAVYLQLVRMEAQGLAVVVTAEAIPGRAKARVPARVWEAGWMAAPVLSVDEALAALEAEIGGAK